LGVITKWIETASKNNFPKNSSLAIPDLLRAFAAFKSETTSNIYAPMLASEKDLFIRATLADILADQPAKKETTDLLKTAFENSLKTDKFYNDAQLSILSALVKLDKKESIQSLRFALKATDHLVRRHAAKLIKQNDLSKDFSKVDEMVGTVKPYDVKTGTKLGQILNKPIDYTRAVSRTNGTVKAVITTEKGKFTIDLFPEDAPLTVDNFIKLAKSNYFNGVEIHRVVPNFVVQDGDPRGDGNGGPGWSIRCEINALPFERGSVGMALSGKDTGGSQWFVTHAPQPHLDGGYTVFGKVNETDMKIVDNLTRGDKILTLVIVDGKPGKRKSN
jgi:cyclophilin family peptidyl-prolyl cis-trans isomerase